jgi:cytochrome c-type biogenesis protein CcmH
MIIAALLLIALVLLAPWLAARHPDVLDDRYSVEVAHHRAALARIAADSTATQLSGPDAQALSLDVQRRLLRVKRSAARQAKPNMHPGWSLLLHSAAIVSVVFGYAHFGHPLLRDVPAPPIIAPPAAQKAYQGAQTQLLQNPANIAAWIDMSMALQSQGETARAVEALEVASRAMPKSADLWVARGQALMRHGGGQMSPAARLAFDRASAIDPSHPGPRLYLALSWLLAGQPSQALPVLEALARSSPADAPWLPRVAAMTRGAKAMIAAGVGTTLPQR